MRDKSHSQILEPSNLKSILQSLKSEPEACSDLLSTLRFFCHPSEEIVLNESNVSEKSNIPEFEKDIDTIISNCYTFLKLHHFSLLEIYGAEFQDLIEDVPDPTLLPIKLLDDFVFIKKELGLWSAERAALLLIIKIDKLKTREKYERHYLLLSVLYTEMVKIRKICEAAFQELSELDKLMQYSTPKLLRLVQVLRQYKPDHVCRPTSKIVPKNTVPGTTTTTTVEGEEKKTRQMTTDVPDETPSLSSTSEPKQNIVQPVPEVKRHRGRYNKFTSYDDPNALCGIVFVENKFMAKLLYHFLKDLSRNDDAYSFLMPQYATDLDDEILEGYDMEVKTKFKIVNKYARKDMKY